MELARIVVLCVGASVTFGILHDQVTARVCVEYFTVAHPVIIPTTSPTILGLLWGMVATWWMGLALGLLLGLCARAGRWPKLGWCYLARPVAAVLLAAGAASLLCGSIAYSIASGGWIILSGTEADLVPQAHHVGFLTDLFAHNAAYLAGAGGGVLACIHTLLRRNRLHHAGRRAAAKETTP